MTRVLAIAVALALALGCDNLPQVTLGSCGNHVVEPSLGEDCDDAQAGCGAPNRGPAACRFVCDPDNKVACPSGWWCGVDRICRQPLGTYSVGPAITSAQRNAGDLFGVDDVDGDGVPDLVVRNAAELNLYRNDGDANFTLLASGRMPALDSASATWPQLAFAGAGPLPLVGAFGSDGVGLFTAASGTISPLVLPTTLLPPPLPPMMWPSFIGVGLRPPQATPAVLMIALDAGLPLLRAFPLGQDPLTVVGELSHVSVPESCVSPGQWAARTGPGPATLIAFAYLDACVARFDANGQLLVQPLARPSSVPLQGTPALADVDGDGLADVVVAAMNGGDARLVWRQAADGSFGAPLAVPATSAGGLGAVGVADFDGDRREDLVTAGQVALNRTTGTGASFAAGGGFVGQPPPPGAESGPSSAAGDLNGDGFADYVVWGSGFATCFGGGDGVHFACAPLPAVLAPSDPVLVGDVNGDSIADVVAVPASGAIQVLLGRYRAALAPVPLAPVPPSGEALRGAALLPASARGPSQLLVYVDGRGIASGVADADGVLGFLYPLQAIDVSFVPTPTGLELWILTERSDGGHLLRLPGGLTATASDVPLGVSAAGARLFRLSSDPAAPYIVSAQPAAPFVATLGTRQSVSVTMLPPRALPSSQLLVDLDGDGVKEIVQPETFSDCGVRVLHQSDGALTAIDSRLRCVVSAIVMDLPPFDGRLDLVGASEFAIEGPLAFVQQKDLTFMPEPYDLYNKGFNPPTTDPTTFTELATVDLNGDGLSDLMVITSDGTVHAVLADVVRR